MLDDYDQTFRLISFWICIFILVVYIAFGVLKGSKEWFISKPAQRAAPNLTRERSRERSRFVTVPDSARIGVGRPFDLGNPESTPRLIGGGGNLQRPTTTIGEVQLLGDKDRVNLRRFEGEPLGGNLRRFEGEPLGGNLRRFEGESLGGNLQRPTTTIGEVGLPQTPQLLGDKDRVNEGVTTRDGGFGRFGLGRTGMFDQLI
jgi:hypothetical protein